MGANSIGRRLLSALAGSTPAFSSRPVVHPAESRPSGQEPGSGRRLLSALAGSTPAFSPLLADEPQSPQRRLLSALAGTSPAFTSPSSDEYRPVESIESSSPDSENPDQPVREPDSLETGSDDQRQLYFHALEELEALVGLTAIKKTIHELIRVLDESRRMPLAFPYDPPNMVFFGSSGPSEVTIAELIGRMYRGIGVLASGHLIVAEPADLVAHHMGQSTLKTRKKGIEALDGVLLVREAHDLTTREFGYEALGELVVLSEQYRDRLAIVLAGAPGPMQEFLDTTPGLNSRFTVRLAFPDPSVVELQAILEAVADIANYRFNDEAEAKALRWLETRRGTDGPRFDQIAAARELVAEASISAAERISAHSEPVHPSQITTILSVDVPSPD